jgi:hypothetical protein
MLILPQEDWIFPPKIANLKCILWRHCSVFVTRASNGNEKGLISVSFFGRHRRTAM